MIRPCRCNPGSTLFLHSADLNALKMKRNDKGMYYFTKSIEDSPSNWQGYSLRDGTYALMEKHVPAAVDFTRAMESKKKPDGLLLFLRGDCYNKLGLIDKAMDDYTKAAELNPKGANSHRHPRIVCVGHEVKYFHCPS